MIFYKSPSFEITDNYIKWKITLNYADILKGTRTQVLKTKKMTYLRAKAVAKMHIDEGKWQHCEIVIEPYSITEGKTSASTWTPENAGLVPSNKAHDIKNVSDPVDNLEGKLDGQDKADNAKDDLENVHGINLARGINGRNT
jgi:hypothetical protein